MPTYTYRCKTCKTVFDLFHSIMDDSEKLCPECGEKTERMMGAGIAIKSKQGNSSSTPVSTPVAPSGFS